MKTLWSKSTLLLVLPIVVLSNSGFSQLSSRHMTRGSDTAEFYLSCQWYADPNSITWNGIFHSVDNGQTLTMQRKTNFLIESGNIFGDSAYGVLYQIPMVGQDTFGVSFDYGKTFEKKYFNDIYEKAAGCMAGELYMNSWELYHGTNYGDNFTLQSNFDSLHLQDVGTLPGEVFWLKSPVRNPLKLTYSNDFGQTYSIINAMLPGLPFIFGTCDIHRGTEPGELYFVVWPHYDTIALFHSFDYGNTVTFQSYMLQTWDEVLYTAGRTPGSFYYARREICGTPPCLHSCLWIFFSRDYGVTFTTYYHNLDSTLTGIGQKEIQLDLTVCPNPATEKLTFRVVGSIVSEPIEILLYNATGSLMSKGLLKKGQTEVTIDIRSLSAGLYFYVTPQNKISQNGKIIISR